jgi:membrane associated rhomboid family serine protease
VLCFALTCVLVHTADSVFGGVAVSMFAIGPLSMFSLLSPLSYWRLLSHMLGHTSWAHLNGNMVNLLLVGADTLLHAAYARRA